MLSMSTSLSSCWFTVHAPDPHERVPGQPQGRLWTESFTAHKLVLVFQVLARLRLLIEISGG